MENGNPTPTLTAHVSSPHAPTKSPSVSTRKAGLNVAVEVRAGGDDFIGDLVSGTTDIQVQSNT